MILKVLGSESAGNCYLLESDNEALILEAGIRLQEIKLALDFDLDKVIGCLVTHAHGDHCKFARDYLKSGINVYTSKETIVAANLSGHRLFPLGPQPVQLGQFMIKCFPVPHGVPTLGFLIKHPCAGSILFVTDAACIPNRFCNLNHILIEANYEDSILTNDRAVGHHMSLDTCLDFLRANDLSLVRNIVLLHLSSGNSDAGMFTNSVQALAPKAKVFVADKGLEVNLSKYPF